MSETRDEKPDECASCDYETASLEFFPWPERLRDKLTGDGRWYCALCAGTRTSNSVSYNRVDDDHKIMATICYVGNAILDAIRVKP